MRVTDRIAWNAVVKWTEGLIAAAVAFFVVRVLWQSLGEDGFAITVLAERIVAFSLVAQLGLRHALGRHLAEKIARQEHGHASVLYSTALLVYGAVAISLTLFFFLAAPFLVRNLFHVPEAWQPQAVNLLRFYAGPFATVSLLEPAFGAVMVAHHRFDLLSYAHIAEVVLRGAGILLVVGVAGAGVYGWAIAMFCGALVATGLTFLFARRTAPHLHLRPGLFSRAALWDLYSLGGLTFVRENVSLIGQRTDPFVISWLLGGTLVAYYEPGLKLVSSVGPLLMAIISQLAPMATGYFATGKQQLVQEVLIRGTRFGVLLGIASSVALSCFAAPIIEVWLGAKLSATELNVAAWVLVLWSVANLLLFVGAAQWPVLLGMNRVKFAVWLMFWLAVLNLLLSIGLVWWMRRAEWGLYSVTGVVIPTILVGIVEKSVISVHTARTCGLGVRQYFRQAYLGPLCLLALFAPAAWLVRWLVDPHTVVTLLTAGALTGLIFLPLCWLVALDDVDRQRLLGVFRRLRGAKAVS